ncbi:MAG TPA: hypothetical protein DCG37_02910 [Lachnospiraceae bacterium]|nr:hypothetical protein [Lachnospiraceae bacterium]
MIMIKRRITILIIGIICMFMFSSCSGLSSKSVKTNFNKISFTQEKGGLMKVKHSSGYFYGQSLWVANCKEYITLRESASTSADALARMPLYAHVTYIADAPNGFLQVVYNGLTGYALAEYLDEYEPQIAIGQYMVVVKCRESITLRKNPSTKAGEICQIPLGDVVYAVKESANGFYMVEYKGRTGYALASYLSSINGGGQTGSGDYYYGQPLWVVKCKEYITLRASASTSAEALDRIPLYAQVTYIGDARNGFLYVIYDGQSGYALEEYLDEYEPQVAIGQYMTVAYCKQSITLRKKPSTKADEICQIPLGDVVYAIKDAGNGFYMVTYGNKTGYVLSEYLRYS